MKPTQAHQRYRNFLHADSGLSFMEWLGVEVPTISVRFVNGEGEYRYHGRRSCGQWMRLKKDAKASYKADLAKTRHYRCRELLGGD